jgi:hypothetical protein
MLKMSSFSWRMDEKHAAARRVVVEGGLANSDGSLLGFLVIEEHVQVKFAPA